MGFEGLKGLRCLRGLRGLKGLKGLEGLRGLKGLEGASGSFEPVEKERLGLPQPLIFCQQNLSPEKEPQGFGGSIRQFGASRKR